MSIQRSPRRWRPSRDRPDRHPTPGGDRGESLLEIVLTVVIVAMTVTALVAGLATAANAANAHRLGVQSDSVLRNAAEAVKSAARGCTVGASWRPDLQVPDGFTVDVTPADRSCPGLDTSRRVEVEVVAPDGLRQTLTIVVRTP